MVRSRGGRRAAERGEGGEEIEAGDELAARAAGGDAAGPASDERHAHAAFPEGVLRAAEGVFHAGIDRAEAAVGALVVGGAVDQHAVVGGEDDERVALEPERAHLRDELADGPVEVLHGVAVGAGGGAALKAGGHEPRHVRLDVGKVKEERARAVVGDDAERFVEKTLRQLVEVGCVFDDALAAQEREGRAHGILGVLREQVALGALVVRVGEAEEQIEAVARREKLGRVAEVPFSDNGGAVAALAEQCADGGLGGGEADARVGHERARDADALGVATGEQRGAARAAQRRRRVVARETHALGGEAVEVGREDFGRAVAAEVVVAEIVGDDVDDVGRAIGAEGGSDREQRAGERAGDGRGQVQGVRGEPTATRRCGAGRLPTGTSATSCGRGALRGTWRPCSR